MRITDHFRMLAIKTETSTIYPALLWDDQEVVLIDACFPGQTEALAAAIEEAGFKLQDITKIILTHQDLDHIGCVRDLIAINPDIQVIAHEDEAPFIDGRQPPAKIAAREAAAGDNAELIAQLALAKKRHAEHTVPVDKTVTAGEVLPFCGGIRIIHTPGHTPGHICLYIKEGHILVAGDALNLNDHKLAGPNPIHTLDMAMAIDSLRQLKNYDIKCAILYHGGYYDGDFQADLCTIIHQ